MIKGSFVQLSTKRDLNNLSGIIAADSAMQLDVGGDLNNKSLTYTSDAVDGASNATRTGITQVASIYIGDGLKGKTDVDGNPLTTLIANVGGNTTFSAGRLDNQGGSSFIDTKGDVNLDAVNVGYQSNSILDNNNFYNQGASADIGSQITGSNDLLIKAGNNISGTATSINSTNGGVGIIAQGNVDFKEGRSTTNLSTAVKTVDKGTFSTTKTQDRLNAQSDQAITSNIEGNTVSIQAGQNIGLRGTNVATDKGVQLSAGGDVSILAAQNTTSNASSSQVKKSGAFGTDGGMGFTIGKQQTDDSNASTSLTHTASNVGAIDGNVIISAGGKYQQTGSNLIAGMGADSDKDFKDPNRGNTVVRAKSITIDSVKDVYTNQSETKSKTSGLTVAVSNSLVDSAKSINSLVDAGGNTDSVRMKGMAGVAGALKVKALAKEANSAGYDLLDGNLKGLGNTRIQATIGSQKSQSNSSSYTEVNQASNITTNNLALIATGAGTDSNINVNGSNLNVSNDALFKADNNFNVNGVAQNSNTRSTNKSSSAAIGGYASTGSGVGITANASRAKGYANSDSVTYANSQINVGGTTTYDIGNDVNIKGGVINTNKAQGVIGGNVNIESLQDTYTYDSKQKNAGFTLDVDILGNGVGSSLSVNGGKTDINADYKAVGEQSGIFTGDGGFDLTTEGKTTLIGGAITTTEEALAAGRNNYVSKGGITTQDIENTSSYEGDAIQVGVSLGMTEKKPQANTNGLGYGTDGDSDSSITKAGITGIAGNSGITTDNQVEYAGALENVFDATRVNKELGAQTEITQEFGKEAPKAVAEFSGKRQTQLILDGDLEEAKKWADGGAYRVALHTLVGAIATGSVEGALASGTTAVSIPAVGKYLEEQGVDETTRNALLLGLSAATGAIVGGDTASTASSVNQTQNNFLSHKERDKLNKLIEKARKNNGKLNVNDSETLTNLIGKDQLTDALLYDFIDGKKLQSKELDALALALNQLVANGGQDAKLAESLMNMSNNGSNLRGANYLDPRAIKRQVENDKKALSAWEKLNYKREESPEEKIYNQAKTTLTINQQQTEIARYGGDAVFGAPGKTLNVMRVLVGAATVASGVKNISEGNKDVGRFEVVGGALLFVPINGKPVPAKNASISANQGVPVSINKFEGMSFDKGLKNHMANVTKFDQRKGITGGHNRNNFEAELVKRGGRITSETPTGIDGITTIRYEIPKLDRSGKSDGYKTPSSNPKTVYNPNKFSDAQILDMGQKAAAKGYAEAIKNGVTQYTSSINGIPFRIYLNKETGAVTNVHPQ